jgi:L-iditol 2-dehydrogenase
MHAELAHAKGADKIFMIDPSEERLKLAKDFHVDTLINSNKDDPVKKVMELTGGEGVDVVITACPANIAQEQAVQITARHGRISFFGGLSKDNPYIRIDSNLIHYREISVFGVFASHRRQYEEALELVSSKKVDMGKFITHKFKLEELVKAIETVKSGKCLKAVIGVQDETER